MGMTLAGPRALPRFITTRFGHLKSGDFYDLAFIRVRMPEIAETPELARCQPTKETADS
jgi:hypothetical protein